MIDYRFNNRIRELRQEAGLTQTELAEKVGVTRNSISLFEKQIMQPRLITAYLIAWALQVDIVELSCFEILYDDDLLED